MEIREAGTSDADAVYAVESAAFGHDKEADLVMDLLSDPSAQPLVSLLAFENGEAVGHILFTTVSLEGVGNAPRAAILAPLAVVPAAQKRGVGGKLIEAGLKTLKESGCELVFVLGHPDYYSRHGFSPAGRLGLDAPYPIPEIHADAWMVQGLKPGVIGTVTGKVRCSNALNKPEHWRE